MDIAKRVKTIRKKRNSVYKLAKTSVFLLPTFGRNGKNGRNHFRICDALDISLADFFAESKENIELRPTTYKLIEKIATLSEESIKYLEEQAELLKIKESLKGKND